ncbi:MAG: hypothetical protein ACRDRR_23135 [Pseudonocardiaceae bacterium]
MMRARGVGSFLVKRFFGQIDGMASAMRAIGTAGKWRLFNFIKQA